MNVNIKVDREAVVRYLLEDDMPEDSSNLRRPDWPEFAQSDDARYEAYLGSLPVVYVDDLAYRFDVDYRWLLPMRDQGEAMRFDTDEGMYDFLDEHSQYGADLLSHSHNLKDTETASIPMADREPHVVYRTGDYAFLKLPEDEEFIRKEGVDMQHCLAWANKDYCQRMRNREIDVYSMTDINTGIPVVDIEVALTRSSYGGPVTRATVTQLRGIRNECPPRDKYLKALDTFFKEYGSDWELRGIRSFDGKFDGEVFLKRLAELGQEPTQESVVMEECPVCEGSKVSKVTGRACTRCEGTGVISKELADRLKTIRSDVARRIVGG